MPLATTSGQARSWPDFCWSMCTTEALRIVVAPNLAIADQSYAYAISQAERLSSLRIGLLENGFKLVAVLPVDVFLQERLSQLKPDMTGAARTPGPAAAHAQLCVCQLRAVRQQRFG